MTLLLHRLRGVRACTTITYSVYPATKGKVSFENAAQGRDRQSRYPSPLRRSTRKKAGHRCAAPAFEKMWFGWTSQRFRMRRRRITRPRTTAPKTIAMVAGSGMTTTLMSVKLALEPDPPPACAVIVFKV